MLGRPRFVEHAFQVRGGRAQFSQRNRRSLLRESFRENKWRRRKVSELHVDLIRHAGRAALFNLLVGEVRGHESRSHTDPGTEEDVLTRYWYA